MRVIRFLQARPYWLYKLATGLYASAVGLSTVYGWGKQSEVFVYPLIAFVLPPTIKILFILALLLSLGETVISFRRSGGLVWEYLAIAFLMLVVFFVGYIFLGPGLPELEHVTSTQYNNHIYNLARQPFFSSSTGYSSSSIYTLYECDTLGMICHALHREQLLVSTLRWDGRGNALITKARVELMASSTSNTISILVEGRVAYTYNPGEEAS